ncbi:MAG: methyltransferase domain-containing protein [Deltaproteobacteria bacterium]
MARKSWKTRLYGESRMIASFYDGRAGYYDALVHLLSLGMDRRYRRIAVERLGLHRGDRVLDLGCGTGLDLPLLSRKVGPNGRVVGLDLSREMLRHAMQRVCLGKYSNVTLIQGNALEIPLRDWSVDAIFCDYLLSTVPAVRVIEEAFRVARPGASMVFADDRLPSRWFGSPLRATGEFLRNGYFNSSLPGVELLRRRLSSLSLTNHFGGLIFILSGMLKA